MQKKKRGVKNVWNLCPFGDGGGGWGGATPNGKNILNFHFDYLHPSLNRDKKMFKRAMEKLVRKDANTQKTLLG